VYPSPTARTPGATAKENGRWESTAALLLGRRSDDWFGTRWASRPGEFAGRLNRLPKYVVSATLRDPRWTNVTVLTGDVAEEVTKLKRVLKSPARVRAG
jgi:hypothetical protein